MDAFPLSPAKPGGGGEMRGSEVWQMANSWVLGTCQHRIHMLDRKFLPLLLYQEVPTQLVNQMRKPSPHGWSFGALLSYAPLSFLCHFFLFILPFSFSLIFFSLTDLSFELVVWASPNPSPSVSLTILLACSVLLVSLHHSVFMVIWSKFRHKDTWL